MSTNALIGVMHGPKFKAIYLHWDGYVEGAGRMLLENYDSAKANHLVAMGDCSVLDKNIGEQIDFDDNNLRRANKQCLFYKRDRQQEGCEFAVYTTFDEVLSEEFEHIYIMNEDVWYYSNGKGTVTLLADALKATALKESVA